MKICYGHIFSPSVLCAWHVFLRHRRERRWISRVKSSRPFSNGQQCGMKCSVISESFIDEHKLNSEWIRLCSKLKSEWICLFSKLNTEWIPVDSYVLNMNSE